MANIFSRFFKNDNSEKRFFEESDYSNPILGTLNFSSLSNYTQSSSMKLSTVYRCVNLISDSIASLPINPYEYKGNWKYINYNTPLYNILNIQPNPFMGKFTFMKLVVVNMLLKGNSFILIDRDNNNGIVKSLSLLDSDSIKVIIKDNDIKYNDIINNKIYDKSQIIHILNYTNSGLIGVSTLSYAATTLGIAYESEQHTSNFFKGGANLAGILRPISGVNISRDKAVKAKSDFINALNSEYNGQSGSIVVLDSGLEYQSITVTPKDSQLLESRAFNVIEICRFFGVPPTLVFDQGGKYSTSEQQQLDYLNNTLTPIIEKIENEFFRKLFLPSEYNSSDLKFNVENLMRLDAVSKANYYTQMFNVGGLTSNEIREKIDAGFPVQGGNRAFIQVNVQPLDNLISEQEQPSDPNNQLDNKLKKNNNTDNE